MKKSLTISLAIFISAHLFSQEKVTHTYSLKQAVDFALDNNHNVKNAKLDMVKAKAFNWEILTQGLPQMSGSVDYNYYFKKPIVPAFSSFFSDPNSPLAPYASSFKDISFVLPNNLQAGFQLNQLLFDARYIFGIQARKDLYKTSRLAKEATDIDIKYAVTKAYYQAEAAQESKALLQENLKLIDKLLGDAKAVFGQGLSEELDVNRLELAQATLQSQINLQNQLAEVGLANLKFQMGEPLSDDIIITDKLDDLKAGLTLSTENKFDPKNRVEYNQLNTAIILQGFNIAQKRSG
ncbi:MAG: transporter, partial [Bacteroidota bacterium]|nr:transporter [Bacteroidota bacterium]